MIIWSATRRAAAKRLFGRPLRVALARWVMESGLDTAFFLQEAQRAMDHDLGEAGSAVRDELMLMCEFGMLSRIPDGRRVYFVPQDGSPLWPAFAAIERAVSSLAPDSHDEMQAASDEHPL